MNRLFRQIARLARSLGRDTARQQMPRRTVLGLEALEDRVVPAISDLTQLAQKWPTHSGPTQVYLNFDGNSTIKPFWVTNQADTATTERVIQEVLFRVSEVFAPFNVQVSRMYGSGNYDRGSGGNTTVVIGGNPANVFDGVKKIEGVTPGDSSDYPSVTRVDHAPNSDDHDVAFVDPMRGGADPNTWYLGESMDELVAEITHEVGHTFGLAHVLTDTSADTGITPDHTNVGIGDIMTYNDKPLTKPTFFANMTFNVTTLNWDGNAAVDGGLPHRPVYAEVNATGLAATLAWDFIRSLSPATIWDAAINGLSLYDNVTLDYITTQNSFTYLTQVLGNHTPDGQMHAAHAKNLDWSLRTTMVPQTATLDRGQAKAGRVTRAGDWVVYRMDVPRDMNLRADVVPVNNVPGGTNKTLDPELLVFDGDGNLVPGSFQQGVWNAAQGDSEIHSGFFSVGASSKFAQRTLYFVVGSRDGTSSGNFTLTVRAEPPVAADDAYSIDYALGLYRSAADGVLANDVSRGGDPLSARLVSGPSHGTLILQPSGSFRYFGDTDFRGIDRFTYVATDVNGESAPATVRIAVGLPTAHPDWFTVAAGRPTTVPAPGVLWNDESAPTSAVLVRQASHGTVTLNADNSFTYTPFPTSGGGSGSILPVPGGYRGPDSFDYAPRNAAGTGLPTTVYLTVGARPVGREDAYDTAWGQTLAVDAAHGVLANDTDAENDLVTAELSAGPSHGTLRLAADGSFSYIPDPGFHGMDSFAYVARDRDGASDPVLVLIHVIAHVPVANNDAYTVEANGTLRADLPAIGVLANDRDADGDPMTAVLVDKPLHGTLYYGYPVLNSPYAKRGISANGTFYYQPYLNFRGQDTFTYMATDIDGQSRLATVTITVTGHPPVAGDDVFHLPWNTSLAVGNSAASGPQGVLLNDTSPDAAPLTAQLATGPVHGRLTLSANGAFTYTPDAGYSGKDSFSYVARDGALSSSAATVTLFVDSPPVGRPDRYTLAPGSILTVAPAQGVLANDSDASGNPLQATLLTGVSHGTLRFGTPRGNVPNLFFPDGSILYTPSPGFSGIDHFTYLVSDAWSSGNAVTVDLVVGLPPVATADTYRVLANGTLNGTSVLANDSNTPGVPLTAVLQTPVAHGQLTLRTDGTFTYVPTAGYHGEDSFTYLARDWLGDSAPVTVRLIVGQPPVAKNDAYAFASSSLGRTYVVDASLGVLANDVLPPGDQPRARLVGGPAEGTIILRADGSFTFYAPRTGYTGRVVFTYVIDGLDGTSNVATVILNVGGHGGFG